MASGEEVGVGAALIEETHGRRCGLVLGVELECGAGGAAYGA